MQRHPFLNTVSSYILKLHAYTFIFMASESEYRSKLPPKLQSFGGRLLNPEWSGIFILKK